MARLGIRPHRSTFLVITSCSRMSASVLLRHLVRFRGCSWSYRYPPRSCKTPANVGASNAAHTVRGRHASNDHTVHDLYDCPARRPEMSITHERKASRRGGRNCMKKCCFENLLSSALSIKVPARHTVRPEIILLQVGSVSSGNQLESQVHLTNRRAGCENETHGSSPNTVLGSRSP